MSLRPDEVRIKSLPVWAQSYIDDLERERELVVRKMREMEGRQETSPYCIEDSVCSGEERGPSTVVHYVTAPHGIDVTSAGVLVNVRAVDDGVELRWSSGKPTGEVAFIPTSYMAASIKAPAMMRIRK